MPTSKLLPFAFIYLNILLFSCNPSPHKNNFHATWPNDIQRTWLGPEFWSNRLQDWEITDGRIECLIAGADRNVNLLTHRIDDLVGEVDISIEAGLLSNATTSSGKNWVGFKLGAKGEFKDYRDDAIYGEGLNIGITSQGQLFIGSVDTETLDTRLQSQLQEGLQLRVHLAPNGQTYKLQLEARDLADKEIFASVEKIIVKDSLTGSIALVSHFPSVEGEENIRTSWFDNWKLNGDDIAHHPDRAFGPILFSQYTLSKQTLKITAQMPPLSQADGDKVFLQVLQDKNWTIVGESTIDPLARTATITLPHWTDSIDVPYRLHYSFTSTSNQVEDYFHEGTIRRNPTDKETISMAGLSCMNDLGFPNTDVFDAINTLNPDILFFAGDQIYEGVGGFGVQREPLDKAVLDYLRKWYLFGWAFGDLFRDRPSITIPDDHDVFQGNFWGAGGIAATPNTNIGLYQRSGGYRMPAEWVKMVERTQTSHLPSPIDPSPIAQGIGVYFTDLNYGGVSFAVFEDRKFKSGPLQIFPEAVKDGRWYWNPDWETNKPDAKLLGERQLNFLENWAADWSHQTWMKVALSQTIFTSLHTNSKTDLLDPQQRAVPREGEYPPDDVISVDFDANGWPQVGRDEAIKTIRKAFAPHMAGDQHLGSAIQYGVEEYGDAGYAFCVPAISNIWPRRWSPMVGGANRKAGAPKYTGDFLDGFDNKITVHAVANPVFSGREPADLYDRATGIGLLKLNKKTRGITMECWPRFLDLSEPDARQFPGWPITVNQMDNYGRKAIAYLPTIIVEGLSSPVVQIIDEANGEVLYTLRINGQRFRPKVFREGQYTIKVSEPDKDLEQIVENIASIAEENDQSIAVTLK